MIPENDDIIWTATDPQNRNVILKRATWDFHIAGADHDERDGDFRKKLLIPARQTIIDPEFIISEQSRNTYFRLVAILYQDNLVKIKPLKVIVDADRQPNEVVTLIPENKLKETVESEAIIYARKPIGIVSDSAI